MKDHEIRPMLDRQLSACEWTAEDTQKLFRRMRKEKPCMKRKLSLAFVMMLLLLLAAGIAPQQALACWTACAGRAATPSCPRRRI